MCSIGAETNVPIRLTRWFARTVSGVIMNLRAANGDIGATHCRHCAVPSTFSSWTPDLAQLGIVILKLPLPVLSTLSHGTGDIGITVRIGIIAAVVLPAQFVPCQESALRW